MASTYSTNLKIELIGTGEQAGTWGTTTNTNLGTALEQAVVGKADVAMSSTTITLTLTNANTAQDARAIYLNLTGSPGGAAVLEVPAIQKPYIVKNGSDQQVTIKVSGLTGVPIPTGKTALVYNNGTDVVTAVDHIPSLTLGAALPVASGGTGITSFGTGVGTALGVNTGSAGAFVVNGGALGTPSSGTLTNATGLPIGTGVSGLGTNVATFLGTPSSANLAAAVTDETGSGALVFATSPTLVTPALGTPSSGTLTNATGLPLSTGVTGLLPVANGGTATATPSLVAGSNVTVSGTWPNQTIASSNSGGTVTSVSGTGTVQGLSLSGTVTSSGNLTLGGSLSAVNLTSQVTGTLPVANGGTGATTLTSNNVIIGNGTSAVQFVAPSTTGNVLTSNGTTWTSAAPGGAGVGDHEVYVTTGNGYGSTNNKIERFSVTQRNVGTAITFADSASLGSSFTINEAGIYAMEYSSYSNATDSTIGISVNSTQLSTGIKSITAANRICIAGTNASQSGQIFVSTTALLAATNVVRPHVNNAGSNADVATWFKIRKIGEQ
jgi:hypothetical protein